MTAITNGFESGINGTAVTTGNSAGTNVTAITAVVVGTNNTLVYDTSRAASPSAVSAKFDFPANGSSGFMQWSFATATATRVVMRFYVYLVGLPGSEVTLCTFRTDTATVANINLLSTGKLAISAGTSNVTASTAADLFPTNQWVRVEAAVTPGTTTSNGTVEYRYFLEHATTPVFSYSNSAVNTGTAAVTTLRLGRNSTVAVAGTQWYDDFRAEDLPSGSWIGPSSVQQPGISVSGRLRYIIQRSVTGGGGGVITYTITQTSGPVTSPAPVSPGKWEVVPNATTPLVYSVTAAEAGGSTVTSTATVPAFATGGSSSSHEAEVELLHFNGTIFG